MKNQARHAYITEEEFNRIVINKGDAQPEDDSPGDPSDEMRIEAEMGEYYPDGNVDDLNKEDDVEIEDKLSNQQGRKSSTWPDPSEITRSSDRK